MTRENIVSRIALLLLSLTLAVAPARAQGNRRSTPHETQQFAQDQEEINKLHGKDIEASIALDASALEALWTDDIATIHPGAPPIIGLDANSKFLSEGIDKMKSVDMLAYNEEFSEVRIVGDIAYEIGLITVRTRPFSGGKESEFKYNIMRILKRQPDGRWLIARSMYNDALPHVEESPKPAEPDKKKEDENRLKN